MPLFELIHVYNNNYWHVILICLQPFCKQYTYKLFFSHDYSLFCSQPFCKHCTLFVRSSQPWSLNTQPQHKTDWLQLTYCSFYMTLLYTHVFSLQNILKVEGSPSRLLETSIATACLCVFSHLTVPHTCYCWFRFSLMLRYPSFSYSYWCYCWFTYK